MAIPKVLRNAKEINIPKGTTVFEPGDPCKQFVYLKSGTVRVNLISKNGKPIMLYRFGAGQTCVLTTSCILSGDMLCGEAIVEEDVEAYIIPINEFEEKLGSSTEFRNLVFSSFANRLASMMERIEEVTSSPIETRLAVSLFEKYKCAEPIMVTHEELAADIGTAREVISRKLGEWHKKGIINRGRGSIDILDIKRLQELSMHRD